MKWFHYLLVAAVVAAANWHGYYSGRQVGRIEGPTALVRVLDYTSEPCALLAMRTNGEQVWRCRLETTDMFLVRVEQRH